MRENRRQILDMLSEGKITADEAERLLAALESESPAAVGEIVPQKRPTPRYLRVLVEADENGSGDKVTKVNIRVPLQLLRAGVKLANLIPREARDHVNAAMRDKGMGFDLDKLKPEDLEELIEQLNDMTIDVDQAPNKVKVRVFCE